MSEISSADGELLQGVIDMHVHAMPSVECDRPFDEAELVKIADLGATIEYCIAHCVATSRVDPKSIAEGIKRIGANRCVMATDLTRYETLHPIEGMRYFIQVMARRYGISKREISMMTRENPARLLGLT
jgi:predicted metal-dependent phosphotriesterase family hydrolase